MKLFDDVLLDGLVTQARAAPRRRANHNLHAGPEDAVQRLFIAIEPGSYVRPHRHPEPEKWEFFILLRGRLALLLFDESGRVLRREELLPAGPLHGFEIPPGSWHSVVALAPGTVFVEVKQGPYAPLGEGDFAVWAPREGERGSDAMCRWLAGAHAGDTPP